MTSWIKHPNAKALVRAADDSDPYGVNEATPLEAGRGLDGEVAEKVMRWKRLSSRWSDENPSGYEWIDDQGTRHLTPPFSTNIASAWLIVEKFGREGWALHLTTNRHENPPAGEENRAMFWTRGRSPESVYAATAPLAICRAALAAEASRRASGSSDRE